MEAIGRFKRLIAKDLRKGLQSLSQEIREGTPFSNDCLALIARANHLDRVELKGVLDYQEMQRERNSILNGALLLVDRLDPDDLKLHSPTDRSSDPVLGLFGGSTGDFNPKHYDWSDQKILWQETFNWPDKQNATFSTYQDDSWSAKWEGGAYVLQNENAPNAIRYHHLSLNDQDDMTLFPCSLEVRIAQDERAHLGRAGLQFAFDRARKTYYVFMIDNQREYQLWHRSEQGFGPLFAAHHQAIVPQAYNRLGVVRHGEEVFLYVNDHYVRGFVDPFNSKGDSGAIAIGCGRYHFDNFTFFAA